MDANTIAVWLFIGALIALLALALAVFGAENMVIPAMIMILAVLLGGRRHLCR